MSGATPWARRVRALHRWVSLAFMLAVVANLVALAMGSDAAWIGVLAAVPLLVLLVTGAALFVLPWLVARGRSHAADPS